MDDELLMRVLTRSASEGERAAVEAWKAAAAWHAGRLHELEQMLGDIATWYRATPFTPPPAVESLIRRAGLRGAADHGRSTMKPGGNAMSELEELIEAGFLAIELDDVAHAIQRGDVEWVTRFLQRHPALRDASDTRGTPFKLLAEQSGTRDIAKLFGS